MARYSDSLLTEGETVVYRSRQHWLSLIIRGRSGLGLLIAALVLIFLVVFLRNIFPDNTIQQTLTSGVGLVLLVIALLILAYRWWQWSNQDYVITNRRLLKVTGIFNKHSADSSLEKINDAILDQPVLGRMLNYGDLTILTAAEEAVDKYHMLKDPKTFKKTMLTQKHRAETEFMYVGAMPPTPPLRADSTTQPMQSTQPAQPMVQQAPPQPMAQQAPPQPMVQQAPPLMAPAPVAAPDAVAPPPAPAPVMPLPSDPAPAAAEAAAEVSAGTTAATTAAPDKSLEVTQTLARLADLRDSGAITVQEYEAKKQELLGRL